MARPSHARERRLEFAPILARAFAELGYRRASTAELAERCGVRENVLYRLWKDKRAMFIAALEYIYSLSESRWRATASAQNGDATTAEKMLEYEATHHGEFGHYRVVFAGLSEADDPVIRKAMQSMYERFAGFIAEQVKSHRAAQRKTPADRNDRFCDPSQAAWALVGLGTILDVAKELKLMTAAQQQRLMLNAGRLLLEGGSR